MRKYYNKDACGNKNSNPNCKGVKIKVSVQCASCRGFEKIGKTFNEIHGENALAISEKMSKSMKAFLDQNPENKLVRAKRCKENADFYNKWVEKYGVEEADKRKAEWYTKRNKFQSGAANVNFLPHVKEMHSAARKALWKDDKYSSKMVKAMTGNQFGLGKRHSVETKTKQRLAALDQIFKKRRPGFTPNYNKSACKYFNELMSREGIIIQHAENGGELFIKQLGYWVDGYDKENNVVYEFDERKHRSGKYPKKDAERQALIERHLGCKFIRIKYDEV